MALILSLATGDFNAGATWGGGVVPGVGDEARAQTGHTVTINVNTTCDEVSNAGTGIFTLNDGVTLTANVTNKSTTSNRIIVQFTAASPAQGFIVGDVTGGSGSSAFGCQNNSTGTLTITGNATGGSGLNALGCNNNSTGTITITGNATGGSGSNTLGCNNNSTGTLTITGNATGGSGSNAFGCQNFSTGTLTITGNATGGSGSNTLGCNNNSTGTLTITGNATGGGGPTAFGCQNFFTGTLTITGNATGGIGVSAFGCQNNSTGTLTINGIALGGTTNGAPGVNALNTAGIVNLGRAKGNDFGIGSTGIAAGFGVIAAQSHIVKIKEIEYGLRGMSPTSGPVFIKPDLGNLAIFQEYPTGTKTLIDATQNASMPAATDVRNGVGYASGALSGSCAVPAAGSVALGVPVDATTGTAVLTAAAIRAELAVELARIDAPISGAGNAPTVAQIRTELDSNSTKLANLDATVSSRLAPSGTLATVTTLTNAPTVPTAAAIASQVRTELTTELNRLDTNVASRAATGTLASDVTAIRAKTDALVTDRLAQVSTVSTTGAQLAAALS